jgi:uncharacterized protein YjbI with pentapeptide repeats
MNSDFINIADALKNEYLFKTEALLADNRQAWIDDFAYNFCKICGEIQKLQFDLALPAITYLEYTMLYTNFINRQYVAEVRVYGDEHYLDKKQHIVGSYDISFLFVYFDELWSKLILTKKRFVGQVSASEVKTFILKDMPDFYSFLAKIARTAIADCVETKQFAGIKKNTVFFVNVGRYMSSTAETVHLEDKDKDVHKLEEWFSERLENEYTSGDYSGIGFSECQFIQTDFRHANFSDTYLRSTNFTGSQLEAVNFRHCEMENAVLKNCVIVEADFSNAILTNASFVNAYAKAGPPNEEKWIYAGFMPASFRNSDLSGADFTKADLTGADFREAVLKGTIFTSAVLDNAVFSDKNAPLTDEQWEKVVIREAQEYASYVRGGKAAEKNPYTDPRYTSYFVMEQLENAPSLPSGKFKEVLTVANLTRLHYFDYIVQNNQSHLISDRLKQLIEKYLHGCHFTPVVFKDSAEPKMIAFWKFDPNININFQADYRTDGYVSSIAPADCDMTFAFSTKSPKGFRSIVVHAAIAQSILHRSILGLKLTRLTE